MMIGIVILNYKTWEESIECIHSIKDTIESNYKIYLIDNNSPNNSYDKLREAYINDDKIVVVKNESNKGYSAGNNVGIKLALKDGVKSILITNSDIIFGKKTIDQMYKELKMNKEVAIIGPKVMLPNGNIQLNIFKKLTFKKYVLNKKPLYWLLRDKHKFKTYSEYDYKNKFIFDGMVSGCCFMLKPELIEKTGFLDENVFLYNEEDILIYKMEEINKKCMIIPNVKVLHKVGSSIGNGRKNTAFSRYHRYYSSVYVLKRYEKLSMIQLIVVMSINIIPFLLNSCIDKEYRPFVKKLISEYMQILKTRF